MIFIPIILLFLAGLWIASALHKEQQEKTTNNNTAHAVRAGDAICSRYNVPASELCLFADYVKAAESDGVPVLGHYVMHCPIEKKIIPNY